MKKIKNNKKGFTRLGLASLVMTIILTITGLCVTTKTNVSAASGGTCPATLEYAMFPNGILYVSQTAYAKYSHSGKNSTDIVPNGRVVAPFSCTIKYIDKSWGYVIVQSDYPVRYADGTIDYMCVGFMHDNNVSDLKVGMHLNQGQAFYDKGTKAGSGGSKITGAHVHINVMRGKFTTSMKSKYSSRANVYIYDAFWLAPNTKITKSGYAKTKWKSLPMYICPICF